MSETLAYFKEISDINSIEKEKKINEIQKMINQSESYLKKQLVKEGGIKK